MKELSFKEWIEVAQQGKSYDTHVAVIRKYNECYQEKEKLNSMMCSYMNELDAKADLLTAKKKEVQELEAEVKKLKEELEELHEGPDRSRTITRNEWTKTPPNRQWNWFATRGESLRNLEQRIDHLQKSLETRPPESPVPVLMEVPKGVHYLEMENELGRFTFQATKPLTSQTPSCPEPPEETAPNSSSHEPEERPHSG